MRSDIDISEATIFSEPESYIGYLAREILILMSDLTITQEIATEEPATEEAPKPTE